MAATVFPLNVVDWLNRNSAAVQAVATVVLVGITGWYAYLTARIARVGEREDERRRGALAATAVRINYALLELERMPDGFPGPQSRRLTEADAADLRELSRAVPDLRLQREGAHAYELMCLVLEAVGSRGTYEGLHMAPPDRATFKGHLRSLHRALDTLSGEPPRGEGEPMS